MSVFAKKGKAHVRILDNADTVVFEADSEAMEGSSADESDSQPDMRAADEAPGGGSVRLTPGDYRVECAMGTSVSTASLHVIPATQQGDR